MFAVRTATVAFAVVFTVLLTPTGVAQAHSFLARTAPVQGERLDATPEDVALQFSEAILPESVTLTVRRWGRKDVPTPAPKVESGGAVVRQPLPELDAGVHVVSWHVTSAVDGHESAGEFAFAVGATSAYVTASAAPTTEVDGPSAVLTWLFFVGLAVAVGGRRRRRRPVAA